MPVRLNAPRRPHLRRTLATSLGVLLIAGLFTACIPDGPTFSVARLEDGVDANPGDGVCEVTPGLGDCSLRAAVMEANAGEGPAAVLLSRSDYRLTLHGSDQIAALGDLDITDSLTVFGNGATIDADGGEQAVDVRPTDAEARVTISDVTVTGSTSGSAVRIGSGRVVVERTTITGNSSIIAPALVAAGGQVQVRFSTISANHGILLAAVAATTHGSIDLAWSTVADNTSQFGYGALEQNGTGPFVVRGSIIEHGAGATACSLGPSSGGYNVVSDDSCGFHVAGDQTEVDPELGPLADHGGLTATHLPGPTSPAVDAIPLDTPDLCAGSSTVDQRFAGRPNGAECDSGAVER